MSKPSYLRSHSLYLQVPLQDFSPTEGMQYAAVWVQWVVGYLSDADLAAFFRRCAAALVPGGCVIVKVRLWYMPIA